MNERNAIRGYIILLSAFGTGWWRHQASDILELSVSKLSQSTPITKIIQPIVINARTPIMIVVTIMLTWVRFPTFLTPSSWLVGLVGQCASRCQLSPKHYSLQLQGLPYHIPLLSSALQNSLLQEMLHC